jgi:hypothetical protein
LKTADFFNKIVEDASKISVDQQALHHYTKARSGTSILNSQEFWARPHGEMKDKSELVSADKIVREIAEIYRDRCASESPAFHTFDCFLTNYHKMQISQKRTVYLCCFSAARDDKAQWITYGDMGRGICLILEPREESGDHDVEILKRNSQVDYSIDSVRARLDKAFHAIFLGPSSAGSYDDKEVIGEGLQALYSIAAIISMTTKHPDFVPEKEVRHISLSRSEKKAASERRSADAGCYLQIPIGPDGEFALNEIMIGSNQDVETKREELKNILVGKTFRRGTVGLPEITVSNCDWSQS